MARSTTDALKRLFTFAGGLHRERGVRHLFHGSWQVGDEADHVVDVRIADVLAKQMIGGREWAERLRMVSGLQPELVGAGLQHELAQVRRLAAPTEARDSGAVV